MKNIEQELLALELQINELLTNFQSKTGRIVGVLNDDYSDFDNNSACYGKRGDLLQLSLVPTEEEMREMLS